MNIVFYESISLYWIALIAFLFLLYAGFIIWKEKKQWITYLILFTIRALVLALIVLYFFKPAIQFIEKKSYIPNLPIFIDHSFSMESDLYFSKKKEWIPKYKYYNKLINDKFLSPTTLEKDNQKAQILYDLYDYNDNKVWLIKNLSALNNPYGQFDMNGWLKYLNNTSDLTTPAVILVSDLNLKYNRRLLKSLKKKIYVLYKKEWVYDTYIKSIEKDSLDNGFHDLSFQVIKRGKQKQEIILTLYHQDKLIATKEFTLDEKDNWLDLPLKRVFKKKTVLMAEVKNKRGEGNQQNDRYFFTVQGRDRAKTIHLIFQQPSFELAFLKRFLEKQDQFNIKLYMPTSIKGPVKLKAIPTSDRVVIGNIDKLSKNNGKILDRYIRRGGLIIFLKGSSDLSKLMKSPLNKYFPFTFRYYNKEKIVKKGGLSLSLTSKGESSYFLNFREPLTAQKNWNDLPFFLPIEGNLIKKKKGVLLAKLKEKPAVFMNKVGKGLFVSILAEPLWKMDFSNLGFGIKSNYYDQFWDELLRIDKTQEQTDQVTLLKTIYNYGDEITIYYPLKKFKKTDTIIIRDQKSNSSPVKLIPKKGALTSKSKCQFLGENQLIQIINKGNITKEVLLSRFYVNYPYWESVQLSNERRREKAEDIAKSTNGKVLTLKSLNRLNKKLFKLPKESHKVVIDTSLDKSYTYYMLFVFLLIITMLLSLEWIIKRSKLGK